LFPKHCSEHGVLANDPKANPPDKYRVLADVTDWTTNIGFPGYATAAIDEVVKTFVIPAFRHQADPVSRS
jgi:hypothetical protein